MWTLSCVFNIRNSLIFQMHTRLLSNAFLSHTVDTNRRYREDAQVSQSIIRSPSALSVQQPVSSRALKISLISSERTSDTWNTTYEKGSCLNMYLCELSGLSVVSCVFTCVYCGCVLNYTGLMAAVCVQDSVVMQMSVNIRSPSQQ